MHVLLGMAPPRTLMEDLDRKSASWAERKDSRMTQEKVGLCFEDGSLGYLRSSSVSRGVR